MGVKYKPDSSALLLTVVMIITLMNIIAICATTIVPTIAVVITFIAVINIRIFASLSMLITIASIMLVITTAITVVITSISSITITCVVCSESPPLQEHIGFCRREFAINVYFVLVNPKAPSYLNSRLLGYVTIRYVEPSSHYLGNWSPREL